MSSQGAIYVVSFFSNSLTTTKSHLVIIQKQGVVLGSIPTLVRGFSLSLSGPISISRANAQMVSMSRK